MTTSAIDSSKPTAGNATTASVRSNFLAAKNEIDYLLDKVINDGFMDYEDTATAGAPISLTANVWSNLTNNGAGANTLKTYKPIGIGELWNASTNRFNFTDCPIGSQITLRTDIQVTTTTANQLVWVSLLMASGGSSYELPIVVAHQFKTAASYRMTPFYGFYVGNSQTRSNPAEIRVRSDAAATVIVNGFYIRASLKGL